MAAALRPGRGLARRARGPPRRRGDRHARQPGRAVGVDARDHEARRGRSCRRPPRSGPADLADRIDRGGGAVRRRATPPTPRKFDERARRLRAGQRRRATDGWARPRTTRTPLDVGRRPSTRAPRPTTGCCSTSPPARRAGPSWSSTPRCPTPSATCRRCTGSACGPATCTSTSPRPGWAKHAWSCFFAPWIAEATIFVYNYARFDAGRAARRAARAARSPRSARRRRCGGC